MGQLLALFILLVATGLATAPWLGGDDGTAAVIGGFLPAVVIHYWALRRASVLPEIAIVFAGLSVDIVSGGPLGLWVSVYALAWLMGLLQARWAEAFWKPGRWLLFGLALGVMTVAVYGVGQLTGHPIAPAGVLLESALWLLAGYPVIAAVLRLADGARKYRPLES